MIDERVGDVLQTVVLHGRITRESTKETPDLCLFTGIGLHRLGRDQDGRGTADSGEGGGETPCFSIEKGREI
jgi:hypothetical protein